jgi:hypothetical protein
LRPAPVRYAPIANRLVVPLTKQVGFADDFQRVFDPGGKMMLVFRQSAAVLNQAFNGRPVSGLAPESAACLIISSMKRCIDSSLRGM